jgi:hypothetical protein
MTSSFSYISVIIPPLKRAFLALYLNKLVFPSSKDNLYQVWLILACWFWRRRFIKTFSTFSLCYYFPLREGLSPSFEQTWIPFIQGWFVPSLVKIGPMVLEKIFKWPHPSFTYLTLSPLWRGPGPSFEQTWILFTQE